MASVVIGLVVGFFISTNSGLAPSAKTFFAIVTLPLLIPLWDQTTPPLKPRHRRRRFNHS